MADAADGDVEAAADEEEELTHMEQVLTWIGFTTDHQLQALTEELVMTSHSS
jgi:hypothetical protein